MDAKMWMVRAGKDAYYAEDFRKKGLVSIGWQLKGMHLPLLKDRDQIRGILEEIYPRKKKGWYSISVGQIYRFCSIIKKDDYIITYNNDSRQYYVGLAQSEAKYKSKVVGTHNVYRDVKWIGEINRDDLSVSTKNSIGAISTLFLIPEDAQQEIIDLLKDKKPPVEKEESAEEELESIRQDMIERSSEFIKDKIMQLDWEDMQKLMAGILRGMGYKTLVSPKGPDKGKDIIASPDGLQLEKPRIFVEVKHRESTKIKSEQLRSFIGGRTANDSCLYVSTGGFSKDAEYEAERSNIPLTLIDSDRLVELLLENYEDLDNDTKALIPLIKLYWPV